MAKVTPTIVSTAALEQASAGNPALRNLLSRMLTAQSTLATKTSTSNKNPPVQSTAVVTYQSPFYLVTFTDPGGATAATVTQAAQQAETASLGQNAVGSVIYHQIQAARSLLFDASGSCTTFGGDAGSLQTQYTLTGLDPTKQWYFRIRTSFDGQTWNQWKILNAGDALETNPYAVSLSEINGGQTATVTLPGEQMVSFGVGAIPSGSSIGTGGGVLLANAIGMATPAGFVDAGHRVVGINACSINSLGVTNLLYQNGGSSFVTWSGSVNYLTFGGVLNQAQTLAVQTLSDGSEWYVMMVSGGGQIAIGQGKTAPGTAIVLPAGFACPNVMGVSAPTGGVTYTTSNLAHGIRESDIVVTSSSATPTVLYGDGSGNSWPGEANWFAIAWTPGLAGTVVAVAGGKYLMVPTPSGIVGFGVGQTASGSVLPLPPGGYTFPKCLAFATPGGFNDIGSYMHGVSVCTIDVGSVDSVGTGLLIYSDGTEAVWDGPYNWFSLAWL